MNARIAGLAAGLVGWLATLASAGSLNVGDDAPKLMVSKFVKGEPIQALDPAKPYVVEFWATWCPPCRTSIPHLTELQAKYKDKGLTIIGVSVFEQEPEGVEPFVDKMAGKMAYSVAMDDVPEGQKSNEGKMAKAWMEASESEGIPTAFIVRGGKVAWIGHPMEMDEPLAKVMADGFDMPSFVAQVKQERAVEEQVKAILGKLRDVGPDEPKKMLALIDEAIAVKPAAEKMLAPTKYMMMVQSGDAKASAYGARIVDEVAADDAEVLNAVAWFHVDPDSDLDKSRRDPKFATRAAARAVELTKGENGAILDTLAVATFDSGDAAKAAGLEEQAIRKFGEVDVKGPGGRAAAEALGEMRSRLEKYRKAADTKAKP